MAKKAGKSVKTGRENCKIPFLSYLHKTKVPAVGNRVKQRIMKKLLCLVIGLLALSSCKNDTDGIVPEIILVNAQNQYHFSREGERRLVIRFDSNTDFEVVIPPRPGHGSRSSPTPAARPCTETPIHSGSNG